MPENRIISLLIGTMFQHVPFYDTKYFFIIYNHILSRKTYAVKAMQMKLDHAFSCVVIFCHLSNLVQCGQMVDIDHHFVLQHHFGILTRLFCVAQHSVF